MSTPSSTSTFVETNGLTGVPSAVTPVTRKDYVSDQEVRWCPGCGDYAVLSAFQEMAPQLGIARENMVVISGIGCSSRFPYYVNSYGLHSIHGRALTMATGLAATRPDLAVFVVTGDGDALSIGGNHLIHALRRNVNLTVLLFNNRIYGLTKGQYSPTSELGKVTKSTPEGSVDTPINPISLALGAEASFVARAIDSDRPRLIETLIAATRHRGSSLVEIYQNCTIYNDGAFDALKGPQGDLGIIRLIEGQPIRFGPDGQLGVVRAADGQLSVEPVTPDNIDRVVVHDPRRPDPTQAFALSRLTDAGTIRRAPVGIFRDVSRPAYDDLLRDQLRLAAPSEQTDPDAGLQALLDGRDTWLVQ